MGRVGIGWDAHPFGGDGPIRLGGVTIESAAGLTGHSDADVLVHAVCDALLGAAGYDDLGTVFPDTDDSYRGINSLKLLDAVGRMVEQRWFQIENVDSVIIAQKPRVSAYLKEMRTNISRVLRIELERVNVKASSPEGLGAIGRAEGIVAQAVALLSEA